MRSQALVILLLLAGLASNAQFDMWGSTQIGGQDEGGTLYEMTSDGVHSVLHEFSFNDGHSPFETRMVEANDGLIYGSLPTSKNGSVIFEFNPGTGEYGISNRFSNTPPNYVTSPSKRFAFDGVNEIVAFNNSGFANGYGGLYEYDMTAETINVLHDFDITTEGQLGANGVFLASNGKYYGASVIGGLNGNGTIWEYDPGTDATQIIVDLDNSTGYSVRGDLVEYNGFIYGVAGYGGANSRGTFFRFDMSTLAFTMVLDVPYPYGINKGLMLHNGMLYGASAANGIFNGYIYELDPNTFALNIRYSFDGSSDRDPYCELVEQNGLLYGSTREGGIFNLGTLFSFDPVSGVHTKLMDFYAKDGEVPVEQMLAHSNGKLYGFCQDGGNADLGLLYEYDPATNTTSTKVHFYHSEDGHAPMGTLQTNDLNTFYTVCKEGGLNNHGTLCEYNKTTGIRTVLHHFEDYETGSNGTLDITLSAGGIIYGTALYGGFSGVGSLFSYDTNTSTFTFLMSFDSFSTGSSPTGAPVEHNGKLYGTTQFGGSGFGGVLYEFDPATWFYQILVPMNSADASWSYDRVFIKDDVIYFTSKYGGSSNFGSLSSYDIPSFTYTLLHTFDASLTTPGGEVMMATDGKLYGTALGAGANNSGGIWSYDIGAGQFELRHSFDYTPHAGTRGAFLEGYQGKLFKTAKSTDHDGEVFEFDINTDTYSNLHSFSPNAGSCPVGGLVLDNTCVDGDGDGVCDLDDNCLSDSNFDQMDTDSDGIGDACDVEECDGLDNDGDGEIDEGFDMDGDGTVDCLDGCPNDAAKTDPGICGCGEVDINSDGDSWYDCEDNCPFVDNEDQADYDGDNIGDVCDDSDGDGLFDDVELGLGTDPDNSDTDDDGINDFDEVIVLLSDPFDKDTDGDGLVDGAEVLVTLTDPTLFDTDGDGCNDLDQSIGACGPADCVADLNGDLFVDTSDLLMMLSAFGSACP